MKKQINWDPLLQLSKIGWNSGYPETKCGEGSTIASNKNVIQFIQEIIKYYRIKTITDLGCGDFNWMSMVDLSKVQYHGYDWVFHRDMSIYTKENILFTECNIGEIEIPQSDLIICKDVMIHMTNKQALTVVNNIIKSSSRLLLATNYGCPDNNRVLDNYAPINIEKEPFPFSSPVESLLVGDNKYLNLYPLCHSAKNE